MPREDLNTQMLTQQCLAKKLLGPADAIRSESRWGEKGTQKLGMLLPLRVMNCLVFLTPEYTFMC